MAKVKDLIAALSQVPGDWHYTAISRDYWALSDGKPKPGREQLGYVDFKSAEIAIYEPGGNVKIIKAEKPIEASG